MFDSSSCRSKCSWLSRWYLRTGWSSAGHEGWRTSQRLGWSSSHRPSQVHTQGVHPSLLSSAGQAFLLISENESAKRKEVFINRDQSSCFLANCTAKSAPREPENQTAAAVAAPSRSEVTLRCHLNGSGYPRSPPSPNGFRDAIHVAR